jgi:hypothetical protein
MKKELISLEGNVRENKGITNVRKIKGKIKTNRKVKMGDQEEVYERNEQNIRTQLCAPEHACPCSAPSRKPATVMGLE